MTQKTKTLYFYTCCDCGCRFQGHKGSKRCLPCKSNHEQIMKSQSNAAARTRAKNAKRDRRNEALRADVARADAAGLTYGVWRSRQR